MRKIVYFCLLFFLVGCGQSDTLLKTIDGKIITRSSLKGKWVLINYWADWCPTCVKEIPEFNRFFQDFQNKNVVLFGINFDQLPLSDQQQLIKKYKISYPSLTTNPAKTFALGDISGVPVTFVINPAGKHVKTLYGSQSAENLVQAIQGKA